MKRAFTLIEVLVTAAIIGLLLAILLPSLSQARAEGRRAVCLSNLKQLGLATNMYLDANRDYFWRYFQKMPNGRLWWFGFALGDPPPNPVDSKNRPLDKSKGVLAPYLKSTDAALQCPSFPYSDGRYWPKFVEHSAAYGYNKALSQPPSGSSIALTRRRSEFDRRTSAVFVFADGIFYDFPPYYERFNEAFYIDYAQDASTASGYAHFRHLRQAEILFIDGHATGQLRRGPAFDGARPEGDAGNLSDNSGGHSIYE